MKDIEEILHNITLRELDGEINRTNNLELKAQYYFLIGGILFSILSTYFYIIDEINNLGNLSSIFLFIPFVAIPISWIILMFTMGTYKDKAFILEKLLEKARADKPENVMKNITDTIASNLIKKRIELNKRKGILLLVSLIIITGSSFSLVIGIICRVFTI